jgi:hypothetical protein
LIFPFSDKKHCAISEMRGENEKFKTIFVPQQAQIQKGEQVSVSSWWLVCWLVFEVSVLFSAQSTSSLHGKPESNKI